MVPSSGSLQITRQYNGSIHAASSLYQFLCKADFVILVISQRLALTELVRVSGKVTYLIKNQL
jgi:hypothetical protein